MSRALRKAQKQNLRQFDASQSSVEEVSEEESHHVPNPFDVLSNNQEDDNRSFGTDTAGDHQEELSRDEQEDIDAAIIASTTDSAGLQTPKRTTKTKKKKKKSKAKASTSLTEGTNETDRGNDAFEIILQDHKAALSDLMQDKAQEKQFHLKDLLAVDVRMLNPEAEMRRIFGSKVVKEEKGERSGRRSLPRGMATPTSKGRKTVLVPMEDNYPPNIKGGLEMTMLEDIDGIKTFKFVHSKSYQQTQFMFFQCVQSGDPQTLMNLLNQAPFHIDTLLQVSEILRHQGDNEQSLEMLTRALFAFDRALHPLFNIASGLARLPFEYPENRPFYLAIYRYIQSLGRRACWSTALEFNKLLYGLAPEEDPYAALLSIDFYAIKARRWDFIEQLMSCPWKHVLDDNFAKPNFDYANGLSQLMGTTGDAQRATATSTLGAAIKKFPYFVGSLFTELRANGPIQYDSITPDSSFAALMRDLYVFRSKDTYNTPEMTTFLRDSALPINTFEPYHFPNTLPMNVCRHILLLDERTLLHYLPKEITQASSLSSDPHPPSDSLPSYLDDQLATLNRTATTGRAGSSPSVDSLPQFLRDLLQLGVLGGQGTGQVVPTADDELAELMQANEFEGSSDDDDDDN